MRRIITLTLFLFASFAQSADFDKGLDAYGQGEFKTAYNEWIPLAEQGNASAQYNLGLMYENGRGVLQDDKQAVYWYRKAAEQGNVAGQTNLGLMYANGRGVPQDDKQAVYWYRKAAEQGDAVGQYNLGVMYANGIGVLQDDKQGVYWYRKAAEQGNAGAQYNLGVMYANGEGVLQDNKKAYMWFNLARYNGYKNTKSAFDFVKKSMAPVDVGKAQEASKICLESNYKKCG